jgi:hypothetical protein
MALPNLTPAQKSLLNDYDPALNEVKIIDLIDAMIDEVNSLPSQDLTGNITGDVTGDIDGDITGDLTGDITGDITGTVTGDITGAITGDITGNITGNVTGAVTGGVLIPPGAAPVNAVASNYVISAATIAVLANGDTIDVEGTTFVKAALTAGDLDFADAAGLATQITKMADFNAVEGGGNVTVTAAVRGIAANGSVITIETLEDTTAGGDGAGTSATATISAATIALIANGDTVAFDGNTFTKVAADPGATDFTNQAGLITLIHALANWTAVDNAGAIDITGATDSADRNGETIDITLNRVTASGVNGTVGVTGQLLTTTTAIWLCTATNTIAGANWKSTALA